MKRSSLFATIALVGFATTLNLPTQLLNPRALSASAAMTTTTTTIPTGQSDLIALSKFEQYEQFKTGKVGQAATPVTNIAQAPAAEAKDATGLTIQQKIEKVTQTKGQFGGGDQLRRFFFGDLEPLSVQPGGAGMVVNLYNKATNTTFAYCATYDVVVAVKTGKVNRFAPGEVK
jgi:hypothetical protein